MQQGNVRYDYTQAGFDDFLNRSIDAGTSSSGAPTSSGGLQQIQTPSSSISFDRAQISGAFGDTVKIGRISINGKDGNIIIEDDNDPRIIMGKLSDGSQGFVISEEGYDVLKVTG